MRRQASARPSSPAPLPTARKAARPASAALAPALEAGLATTFRRVFRLPADADLQAATTDSIAAWDSLGHLRLAMEIEQSLGRRIPGDRLGHIHSYEDLRLALAG